jgi:NAD+ diphosphatase
MLQTPSDFVAFAELDDTLSTELQTLHFLGNELLVDEDGRTPVPLTAAEDASSAVIVGKLGERTYRAAFLQAGSIAPSPQKFAGLRSLFGIMDDDTVAIAGRAIQLLQWDRTHRFCGACGTPTERLAGERARRCPACQLSAYPRIAPAMMCLVTRGDEILLARNVNFPPGRYSALAGFLEAGESIEDAVHREVREEVGIEVSNLRYFASQSWPFPHSLMIAFTAEYAGGELTPNRIEIAEAEWFSKDRLPQLPPRVSIARALIDETLRRLATA